MQFNREIDGDVYFIRRYSREGLVVGLPRSKMKGEGLSPEDMVVKLQQSAIVLSNRIIDDWSPQCMSELRAEHIEQLCELRPELVLLGTGEECHIPDAQIIAPLINAGIGVEFMGTSAACRTYNILVQDGRSVAAALLVR